VSHLAAPLFLSLCLPAAGHSQTPVRLHDASFAVVRYETGITAGAFTLYDAAVLADDRTTRAAYALGSLFQDGRVSMQAGLEGSRRTAAIPAAPRFSPLFTTVRGEVLFDAATTIQSGYMPTAQLTGRSRVRFERADQGGYAEAAITRAFDGRFWQTVVQAEAYAWARRGNVEAAVTATPMQLGLGDVLMDTESRVTWTRGRLLLGSSLGLRLGEADRGASVWGGITASSRTSPRGATLPSGSACLAGASPPTADRPCRHRHRRACRNCP